MHFLHNANLGFNFAFPGPSMHLTFEPPREKTNNVDSEQV